MSWQAKDWALLEAPMPKSDPAARLVLIYLGEKADKHGRDAYPQAWTISQILGLNKEVVARVLKRLVGYGLISKDGLGPDGQPNWRLHLDQVRTDESCEAVQRKARADKAARQARWRQKQRSVDDRESSTYALRVVDSGSSTDDGVDDRESSCRRSRVVSVDDRESPHNLSLQPVPLTCPPDVSASAALALDVPEPQQQPQKRSKRRTARAEYTDDFEAFWAAYGRKGGKQEAAREWHKAIQRADRNKIMAAVAPYLASKPDPQYRKDAERWLKNDGWESAIIASTNGHQPYRNPTNQDEYNEPLLPKKAQ